MSVNRFYLDRNVGTVSVVKCERTVYVTWFMSVHRSDYLCRARLALEVIGKAVTSPSAFKSPTNRPRRCYVVGSHTTIIIPLSLPLSIALVSRHSRIEAHHNYGSFKQPHRIPVSSFQSRVIRSSTHRIGVIFVFTECPHSPSPPSIPSELDQRTAPAWL